MKKLLIIAAVIILGSCAKNPNYKPLPNYSDSGTHVKTIWREGSNYVNYSKVEIDNHSYIIIEYREGIEVLHDPDCNAK
jgi:hypothetical protein